LFIQDPDRIFLVSEEVSITAKTKMASNSSQVAQHFELEAIERMEVFELDGTNCVYDQGRVSLG
jgi:hypothetical protein